jgi:flagellar hook-associated protein FlgK
MTSGVPSTNQSPVIVDQANLALADIAQLNDQIIRAELGTLAQANDLRDVRQKRIEDLAKLVHIDTVETSNGGVDLSVDGVQL